MKDDDLSSAENGPFWGHIGLKFDGMDKSEWFPVTQVAAETVCLEFEGATENGWLSFVTRLNQLVTFRVGTLTKICFLEDAADQPEHDWSAPDLYEGFPLSFVDVFEQIRHLSSELPDWNNCINHPPSVSEVLDVLSDKDSEWTKLIRRVSDRVKPKKPLLFLSEAVSTFITADLEKDDPYFDLMHRTHIIYSNGSSENVWAEPESLLEHVESVQIGDVPLFVKFVSLSEGIETYFLREKLSAVIVPLADAYSAQKRKSRILMEDRIRS